MALRKRSIYQQTWISILFILGVAGISYLLSPVLGYRVAALILLFAVSLLAITMDILPVLLSAILSAFIWNFFFIPPQFTIHVNNTEDGILLSMYFVIALVNGVLTNRIRKAEQRARIKEERANSVGLYNTVLDALAHELRTPITAIIAATDNLKQNAGLDDATKEQLVNEIEKASLRLNQQVENLLHLSRLESGFIQPKPVWCDVVELVYNVVRRVEEVNPGRNIKVSINQDTPVCMLDKDMLDQVLFNLLNNAAIHTPLKASIFIDAACHTDLLLFTVADTGPGFSDEERSRMFKKFARVRDSETNGAGLGLSIVKGFIDALGGHIELRKRNGGGAQFDLQVPVKIAKEISK